MSGIIFPTERKVIIWSDRVQEGGLVRRPQEENVEGSQLEC